VSLFTENGNTKGDFKLLIDDSVLAHIKDGFAKGKDAKGKGKDLVVSIMGEEQVCAGGKN
jgi:translation initiation factor 5A